MSRDFSNGYYTDGYIDGIKDFQKCVNNAVKLFNSGKSISDILNIFNSIVIFLYQKHEEIDELEFIRNIVDNESYLINDNTSE